MMATSMLPMTTLPKAPMDAKDVADTKDSVRPSTSATDIPMSPTSTPPINTTSKQDEASSQQDTSLTALARTFSVPAPHLAPNSPTAINDVGAPFSRTVSAPASVPQEGHPPHFPPQHASSLPPQYAPPSKTSPLPRDPIEDEFDVVVDETLPMGLQFVLDTLWRDDQFTIEGLKKVGETNVTVSQWADKPVTYTAFNRPETFQSERRVTFVHNKKNFIGPSAIPTTQIHRYTYTPGQRLVVSVTSSVHDAPFCDYFRAESRWVFDASLLSAHECSLVSGMRLNWAKSTFLKGQIEGFAKSESKSVMLKWVKQAIDAYNSAYPSEKPVHRQDQGPVAAAASEDGRKKDQDAVATMTTTKKLNPDTSLLLLRQLNVMGVVVLVVLLLQLMVTLYNLRTTTNESVRLQKQHQVLLSQFMDKMKCVKSSE